MHINKKISNIILISVGFFLASCEDYLNPGPDNFSYERRILEDAAFAEGVLLNAYLSIPNFYDFHETATDDAVSNDITNNYRRMARGEWSSQFNPLSVWNDAYHQIYYLNYFLNVVDSVNWSWRSPERNEMFKQRFTGEALAFRAWFNFELLKNHGGISPDGNPLGFILLEPENYLEAPWDIPRESYEKCVKFIVKDCDQAINLLPAEYENQGNEVDYNQVFGEQNKQRINGRAAKALKARVLLHAASMPFYNVPDKWEVAADAAALLLTQIGGISGLSATGLHWYNNDADKEIIWRRRFQNINSWERDNFPPSLFGNGRTNPTQNLVDAFPMANGYPITNPNSGFDEAHPYLNRDPRLSLYIAYNGNKIGHRNVFTHTNADIDGLNNTPTSTRTGYYLKKLMHEEVNLNPTVNSTRRHFYTFFRYTEMFLTYAEAANEAWGPNEDPKSYGFTAAQIIGALRKRAGITQPDLYLDYSASSKEQLRELIRNERRIELCFEGFRFWDMRRWNQDISEPAWGISITDGNYTIISVENRVYHPYMYYGPVPYHETLKNKSLNQNAGW
jgi:starch-binding outer membrane protein, SusD/RagB family